MRNILGGTVRYASMLYQLAIAFWVGGNALFTFILTPLLFKNEGRDSAARIVGILFPGYFRWGMICGAVALGCRLVMRGGRVELATVILAAMLAITTVQALYVEPKAAAIKREIVSFEQTTKDHPLRQQFGRLHGVSAACNLAVLAGGVALVLML